MFYNVCRYVDFKVSKRNAKQNKDLEDFFFVIIINWLRVYFIFPHKTNEMD